MTAKPVAGYLKDFLTFELKEATFVASQLSVLDAV